MINLLFLPALLLLAGADGEGVSAPAAPLLLEGRWVLDSAGKAVAPRTFQRGLQTSGLVMRGDELWAIGDQRAEWPGQLLRIDPKTARLAGDPILMRTAAPQGAGALFEEYKSIPNSDFEGLAIDPNDPSLLYGVTEDKRQWVVRIRLGGLPQPEAVIETITALEFPPDLKAYQDDLNYRVEGIAVSDDGKTLYLAWERAADQLPRIFSIRAADTAVSGGAASAGPSSGGGVKPALVPIDFSAVKPRADKPKALLNLNDIQFFRRDGKPLLVAVARDQERILVISLEEGKVERSLDLDLRAPAGEKVLWVSPEGLALDRAGGRFWIINDPDSIRGNYKRLGDAPAEGNFAAMAPLLFEGKLSAILGPAGSTGAAK